MIIIPLSFMLCAISLYAALFFSKTALFINLVRAVGADSDTADEQSVDDGEIIPEFLGEITYPKAAEKYATLTVENRGMLELPVYFGDDDSILKKGIGHFAASSFPGEGERIIYSAHRNTYFSKLGTLKTGDYIILKTKYGVFTYTVYKTEVVKASDNSILENESEIGEELVLYTCYPFNVIGYNPERYIVYAGLSSGPKLKKWGDG